MAGMTRVMGRGDRHCATHLLHKQSPAKFVGMRSNRGAGTISRFGPKPRESREYVDSAGSERLKAAGTGSVGLVGRRCIPTGTMLLQLPHYSVGGIAQECPEAPLPIGGTARGWVSSRMTTARCDQKSVGRLYTFFVSVNGCL